MLLAPSYDHVQSAILTRRRTGGTDHEPSAVGSDGKSALDPEVGPARHSDVDLRKVEVFPALEGSNAQAAITQITEPQSPVSPNHRAPSGPHAYPAETLFSEIGIRRFICG